MYARVNIIFGKRDRVDDGLALLEGTDRAAVEASGGNKGLTTLVDRDSGVLVAVSYWDEPALSSGSSLTRARERAAAAVDGDLVVESFEVALEERLTIAAPGAVVRMARVQVEPDRVGDGLAFIREQVVPRLQGDAGLCSAELLIDRATGSGVFVTTWNDMDGAARADAVLDQLRDEAVQRVGARFPRTETYSLVRTSAHLN